MTIEKQSSLVAVLASLPIHSLFCYQAVNAAAKGGMIQGKLLYKLIFLPHTVLMYFLPPDYPFLSGDGGTIMVDWRRFSGKLAVAFPASLVYGFVFGGIWYLLFRQSRVLPET